MSTIDLIVAVLFLSAGCYGMARTGRLVRDRFNLSVQPLWSRVLALVVIVICLVVSMRSGPTTAPACFPLACWMVASFLVGIFSVETPASTAGIQPDDPKADAGDEDD